jgi:hypothetical protein
VPVPAEHGAARGQPPAGPGRGRRASRDRRRRLAVVVVPVPIIIAIITVPLLVHGGGTPAPAANGPTARPATNAAGSAPAPPRSDPPVDLPTGGPSGRPGTGPSGPHASGAATATPTDQPPASRPAGPATTPPVGQQGGTGLPPTLVVCRGSTADVLCPTTPTCWDVVVPVGASGSAPPPEKCSEPHRVEAYAAGRLPAAGNPNPATAHVCTPARMRARSSGDIKGWKRDVQQLLIPGYGWFFYCVAGAEKGSPVTGPHFVTGP